ncbi:NADH-dependent flavin oxidoreductase [Oceanivirga salmonicida]|nr:NADH-dependent flavin oxidoreductase [Oceanivirga salmonicida]
MNEDILFNSLKLPNGVVLENRFVLSPMVTNSSTKKGFVTEEDLKYAKRRAKSAPMQITGAAYVDEYGQLFEFGFSAAKDEDIEGLKKLANVMKSENGLAILQLTHAGRFSSHTLAKHGFVYGPSEMKLNFPINHEVKKLTVKQIENLVKAYENATIRAIKAGFDGIEISSAQRLLIQTFFSKFSNERLDEYGCKTLKSRSKFALDILKAVQKVINENAPKNFIFGFRATPEETRGNQIGYSIDEFMEFLRLVVKDINLDYLAIASWGHDVFRNKVRSSGKYYGQLINKVIKENFKNIPVMANGGINTYDKIKEALNYVDLVGLSTPLVVDPEFLQKIKEGRTQDINFKITFSDLESLAIPKASFKDIVPLMDYGESIPKETRELFRKLSINYIKGEDL